MRIAAGDNPHRLRSESSFAALCGVSPVEASSGKLSAIAATEAASAGQRCAAPSRTHRPAMGQAHPRVPATARHRRSVQTRDHSLSRTLPNSGRIPNHPRCTRHARLTIL
ncbi:transposase [Saccharopolyspora sp. NPDC000995]